MTTTVIIKPYGHYCEATIRDTEGHHPTRVVRPDPHVGVTLAVYDGLEITVRETGGFAPAPEPKDSPPLTYGEKAVGLMFNPSGDPAVEKIKQVFARVIDDLWFARDAATSLETKRLCSIAITEAQAAQMWAVKAVTWED